MKVGLLLHHGLLDATDLIESEGLQSLELVVHLYNLLLECLLKHHDLLPVLFGGFLGVFDAGPVVYNFNIFDQFGVVSWSLLDALVDSIH